MNINEPYWWDINIGPGNGLVPSGNKPLPEPMLTQIYGVTRPQWVYVVTDEGCHQQPMVTEKVTKKEMFSSKSILYTNYSRIYIDI